MPQMVTGRKYSAKTRCFTAVIFDPVTEIMSSLPRCNHQTISEIWSKSTMRRLARGATLYRLLYKNANFKTEQAGLSHTWWLLANFSQYSYDVIQYDKC